MTWTRVIRGSEIHSDYTPLISKICILQNNEEEPNQQTNNTPRSDGGIRNLNDVKLNTRV
jgi:hypothetical protein